MQYKTGFKELLQMTAEERGREERKICCQRLLDIQQVSMMCQQATGSHL